MTDDFKTLAAQLRDLQDATKAQIAGVMARAEEAGLDPAGLRRFVSWKRKDEAKRAQQEAIDQQCRYLAGERETPAQLPVGCELSQALNLYRRGLTVRQVAEELRVSTGKAGKLKQLSRMFTVHVHETVDKMPDHDPDTGEITKTADLRNTPAGDTDKTEVTGGRGGVAGNHSAGEEGCLERFDDLCAEVTATITRPLIETIERIIESERVARPLHIARPDEDLPIPHFLDQRHKARARATG